MTNDSASDPSRIVGSIFANAGHFRRPRMLDPEARLHKEWLHFCVLAGDVTVIINFSISGDLRGGAGERDEVGRVVLLAHDGNWHGDIDTISRDEISVRAGRIDARFATSSIRQEEDGAIVVEASLESRAVSISLRFEPVTVPLLRPNTLLDGAPIHWLVMPRLVASGSIRIGERSYAVDKSPAYHDHNWGKWRWGHDFGWTWGFGLPDSPTNPWCAVFTRLSDLARTQDFGHGLFVWKNHVQRRIFQEGSVRIHPLGLFKADRVPKFPSVMGLVVPELTTDVPRVLEIEGSEGQDRVRCVIEVSDLAQIIVPNETNLGYTIINEVLGRMWLSGVIGDERVSMEGSAAFELLTRG